MKGPGNCLIAGILLMVLARNPVAAREKSKAPAKETGDKAAEMARKLHNTPWPAPRKLDREVSRKRFTPEQMIGVIRQAEVSQAGDRQLT